MGKEQEQLSQSCSVLSFFFFFSTQAMTGRCNIQNVLLFLACLRAWELSLTLWTMRVTVLSPPDREQKAGSDVEFHLCPLLARGRGSLTASLCTGAIGKPAYWLCQLLHSLGLGETQACFVSHSCTRALMFPQESPVLPSPLQLHPWLQGKEHKQGDTTGMKAPCCSAAHRLHSQPIWQKSGVMGT